VRCHVLEGTGPLVYGGDVDAYRDVRGDAHGGTGGASCVDCHVVHGASLADDAGGAGVSLRALAYQDTARKAGTPAADRDVLVSVWCTGCHPRWSAPAPLRWVDGAVPAAVWAARLAQHPMGPGEDGVGGCLSCHSAPGFPHATPGSAAGLPAAAGRDSDAVCLRCHPGVGVYY